MEHLTLFVVLVALQLADAYTTLRILRAGGRELNPVMRSMFERFGHLPVLVVKGVFVTGVAVIFGSPVVELLCAWYAAVALWNINQLVR